MDNYKDFTGNINENAIKTKKADISLQMLEDSSDKIKKTSGMELNSELKNVTKGTGILFIGGIIETILGLASSMLVARAYSVEEFGLYGLAIFVVSFFLGKSSLGIFEGSHRFISYYRGKRDNIKIKGAINSSLIIASISSTIFAILLFFLSDYIAIQIFGIEKLSIVIKIAVIGLPFHTIFRLVIAIFRGFESTKENVYFSNVTWSSLKISFYAFVIFLGLSFKYVMVAYTLCAIITSIVSLVYLTKKLPNSIKTIKKPPLQTRPLLSFSWPLIFSGFGWFLISGTDKLMLGILKTEYEVGLYTPATSLARYLLFFYTLTVFIYQPVVSRLLAENRMDDIKRNYQILTKWIFILISPFFILFLLFPETPISLLYGEKYLLASTALQILTIPYFVHIFLGLNGATLISLGKTKMVMYFTLIGGSINIALNYFLISQFGIEGAALSTMISYMLINILNGVYLFRISKIHPFRKNHVLPIVSLIIVLFFFYTYIPNDLSLTLKILSCLALLIVYFIIIIISKSIDREDIQLFLLFENKLGIRLNLFRKIIKVLSGNFSK